MNYFRIGEVNIMEALQRQSDSRWTRGASLLSVAAEHNNPEMAEFLMDKECNERKDGDRSGAPPFLMAIQEGNIEVLKVLDKSASFDQTDVGSKNVFHYAFASKKPTEVTKYLMKRTSSEDFQEKCKVLLTAKDSNEETPST